MSPKSTKHEPGVSAPDRVWVHKKTGLIGYAVVGTWFGDVFFFADHGDHEVLNPRFCKIIGKSFHDSKYSEFIDLGEL